MQSYVKNVKTKMVCLYIEAKSIVATQQKFQRHFKTSKGSSRTIILSRMYKFLVHIIVQNLKKERCDRKNTKRTPANGKKTQEPLQRNPNKSLRRLSQELRCRKTTAQRLARTDSQLLPYKVSVHQTLAEADK